MADRDEHGGAESQGEGEIAAVYGVGGRGDRFLEDDTPVRIHVSRNVMHQSPPSVAIIYS